MLTLVTGGSGSGKSAFAEDRVLSFGDAQRIYIATMHPFDEESQDVYKRQDDICGPRYFLYRGPFMYCLKRGRRGMAEHLRLSLGTM